jgi:hypothetical protein
VSIQVSKCKQEAESVVTGVPNAFQKHDELETITIFREKEDLLFFTHLGRVHEKIATAF